MESTGITPMMDWAGLFLSAEWTNGTIDARDAVSLGARILCDHFTLFTDLSAHPP